MGRNDPRCRRSRDRRDTAAGTLVVPGCAIAICGYTLYKSIHPSPAYTGIVKWAPWVALIWLAAGVLIDVVLTATRPEKVSAFGSILAASEGPTDESPMDSSPAPAH